MANSNDFRIPTELKIVSDIQNKGFGGNNCLLLRSVYYTIPLPISLKTVLLSACVVTTFDTVAVPQDEPRN